MQIHERHYGEIIYAYDASELIYTSITHLTRKADITVINLRMLAITVVYASNISKHIKTEGEQQTMGQILREGRKQDNRSQRKERGL